MFNESVILRYHISIVNGVWRLQGWHGKAVRRVSRGGVEEVAGGGGGCCCSLTSLTLLLCMLREGTFSLEIIHNSYSACMVRVLVLI